MRDLIHTLDVHAAGVGEEEEEIVELGAEEMLDEIIFTGAQSGDAFAATFLRTVIVGIDAFDITDMGHRDDHLFFFDQILHIEIFDIDIEGGTAFIRIFPI